MAESRRAEARSSKPKPDDEKPAEKADEVETSRDGICVQCWPDGWPSEDSKNASCVHGVWKR
jgi:hypothetical protein